MLIRCARNRCSTLLGKLQRSDGHQQGGSSLAPWESGEGSYPIGGAEGKTIGYVLGPSADHAIGERVLADNPGVPYRHLVYRVGQKNNDIWNMHSHAGPFGTQNPVQPETESFAMKIGPARRQDELTALAWQELSREARLPLDWLKGAVPSYAARSSLRSAIWGPK